MPDSLCASPDRHRMVADAILLERAAGVMERRYPHPPVSEVAVVLLLRNRARLLRLEAEDA